MTKPVTLSDRAFAALKAEKKDTESMSQVVMRLLRESRAAKRDPMRFTEVKIPMALSAQEHREILRASDEADRAKDAWQRARDRHRGGT